MTMADEFRCGSRDTISNGDLYGGPDRWVLRPNGDRTCSFCGSLCEEDFIAICADYADGKPGVTFDPSTKGHKFYASRAGVRNADGGGIKFYTWHVDRSDKAALGKRAEVVQRAIERFNGIWKL